MSTAVEQPASSAPAGPPMHVLVSSLPSDCHTWNLVFLQRYLEELGHRVTNLGPCVGDEMLVEHLLRHPPDLVVLSSVNGHALNDAPRLVRAVRSHPVLAGLRVVIGGKLTLTGSPTEDQLAELVDAGFDAVFGEAALSEFQDLLSRKGEIADEPAAARALA